MKLGHRRSMRLKDYDYAQSGAYFVTICARQRECLFGEIAEGTMRLNNLGRIVEEEWLRSGFIRQEIELDEFVIMPNHLHGIVVITSVSPVGATGRSPLLHRAASGPAPRSLGSFIAGFKAAATARINATRRTPGGPVWQRNYYEHVIRDDADLLRIRQYILDNPTAWDMDEENPNRRR
ncbi:MAG: transposase [Chloroflexota bacterium]